MVDDLLDLLEYRVPHDNPRDWYDPYILLITMIVQIITATILLVYDLFEHFMGCRPADRILPPFLSRMNMVYTTVPSYLEEVKRISKNI